MTHDCGPVELLTLPFLSETVSRRLSPVSVQAKTANEMDLIRASPGKLKPIKERMQDKMRSFSPIKEMRREERSRMAEVTTRSPLRNSFLRSSVIEKIGAFSEEGSPKKPPPSETKADESSTIGDMMAEDHVDVRKNLKKAFSKDVASFKDAFNSSKDVLASLGSPIKSKRKHSNLINENRQYDSIDLSVNMCGDIIEEEEDDGKSVEDEDEEVENRPKKFKLFKMKSLLL